MGGSLINVLVGGFGFYRDLWLVAPPPLDSFVVTAHDFRPSLIKEGISSDGYLNLRSRQGGVVSPVHNPPPLTNYHITAKDKVQLQCQTISKFLFLYTFTYKLTNKF
jgi:hypothetical protein